MDKIEIKNTKEYLYYEKLDNGLEVYMIPNNDIKDYYVSFATKFGSIHTTFNINNKRINVPNGIAHFLEHKMFEQENKVDPFTFFAKSGCNCNAYTSHDVTNYIFNGNNNLFKNLNYLLDYVQSPYFTDENVEKEKGIIEQELLMYEDLPDRVLDEKLFYNLYNTEPYTYPIGGEVVDIKSITNKLLNNYYNDIYNTKNMIIDINGRFNYNKTNEVIKNNQNKKEFNYVNLKLEKYNEPNNVSLDYEEKHFDLSTPLVGIGVKIPHKNNRSLEEDFYYNIIFDYLFDETSEFIEKLKQDNIIVTELLCSIHDSENHKTVVIETKSNNTDELILRIKEILKSITIDNDFFERKKKSYITWYIAQFEYPHSLNFHVVDYLVKYKKYPNNINEIIKNLNKKELDSIIETIDLTNVSVLVLK